MQTSTRTPGSRKVVLYGRVSQARHETTSVPAQLAELRSWATREGWQVVAEYSDDGISASRYAGRKARPGWQQVMETVTSGCANTLAVWEISRASRDRSVFAALLLACSEAGVMIATGGRLHDPNDPEEGFMLDLGGALAVRESSVISKRTKRDVRERAMAGRPHSALPYGYRRVCDRNTGRTLRWEIHPEQAEIVREIVRRLLAREPADGIAKDLNRRGIPTIRGKVWHSNILSELVKRPTYAGLRVYNGKVLDEVKVDWPAIISEADHYELLAIYNDPDRDKFRNPKHQKYLGTGLYRCGRDGCSGRMRTVIERGKPNRYACRDCHRVSRLQDPVDELVEALLIARLSQPDILDLLSHSDDAEISAAREEERKLRAKLAQARQLVEEDRLSVESLADLDARLMPKIKAAQQRAQPRNVPAVVRDVAGESAKERWNNASIVDRRAILDTLIEVTVLPMKRRFSSFDPSFIKVEWKS